MNTMNAAPVPTESIEQQTLFRWAALASGKYPELKLLYHIPNEGKRTSATGGRMKAEGLRKGVPDICLPVARGGCHGLYIEMKRVSGGRVTPKQLEWIDALTSQGYHAAVCNGWENACRVIEEYLRIREW